MTRKELFNKLLDQEFTEEFICNNVDKSSFVKFRDNLLKFLLEELDLTALDTS